MRKTAELNLQKSYAPYGFFNDFPITYDYYIVKEDSIDFLHQHNTLEIGYCIKGSGIFQIDNKTFPFGKDNICIINSSEHHALINNKGIKSEWCFIQLDPEKLLFNFNGFDLTLIDYEHWSGPHFRNILNTSVNRNIINLLQSIATEFMVKNIGYEFVIRCLASILLYNIVRMIPPENKAFQPFKNVEMHIINPALTYIQGHFNENIDIHKLALLCSIHIRKFERLFRKAIHKSPIEYWYLLRVKMAKDLLLSSKSRIIEISNEVGFQNLPNFTRYFKKETGVSPKKWRKKYGTKKTGNLPILSSRPQTTIRLAHIQKNEEAVLHIKIKEAFERENPDIHISLEQTNGAYFNERIMASIAGGNSPDIIFMDSEKMNNFCQKNLFIALNDFFSKDNKLKISQFYSKSIEMCGYKGKLYILPRDIAPYACMYYNKTMFDQERVPYPDENWTMKDLLITAKKFVKLDSQGKPQRFGFCSWFWINIVYSSGGRWVDNLDKPRQFLFTSKKSLDALQLVHDMMYKFNIAPSPEYLNKFIYMPAIFTSGKSAMMGSGIWDTPEIMIFANFDWDMVPFPEYKNGIGGSGSGYGIFNGTKYPEQAWKVVKFFAGYQGQKIMSESGLIQPAIRELATSKAFLESTSKPKNKSFLDKSVDYMLLDPKFDGFDEFLQQVIYPNIVLFDNNKITVKQFKSNVDSEVRKRFPWLEIPEQ